MNKTILIETVKHEDDLFSVTLILTGLTSQRQADIAVEYMKKQLCGEEIKEMQ